VNPYLDPIRSDPRYKAIMARTWNSHGGNSGIIEGKPTTRNRLRVRVPHDYRDGVRVDK
jgi:hypothetical protein